MLNLFACYESHHKPGCNSLYEDDFREYMCGWGAAFINVAVTFPINKIMFRQMVHGVATQHALHQIRSEGLRHLYRGCLPPLIQKTINVSIMFGSYSGYKRWLEERFCNTPTFLTSFLAAMMAGSTEAILTPLERVQVLLQDRDQHHKFRNTWHAFRELRPFGIPEYYRGLVPILLRNGPSTWCFFTFRETARDLLPFGEDANSTPVQAFVANFISGAVVGACISTVFYPINVVKTVMQIEYGTPFMSLKKAFDLAHIQRDKDFRKFFLGAHINYTRALVSWGIINAVYESFRRHYTDYFHPCSCDQIREVPGIDSSFSASLSNVDRYPSNTASNPNFAAADPSNPKSRVPSNSSSLSNISAAEVVRVAHASAEKGLLFLSRNGSSAKNNDSMCNTPSSQSSNPVSQKGSEINISRDIKHPS